MQTKLTHMLASNWQCPDQNALTTLFPDGSEAFVPRNARKQSQEKNNFRSVSCAGLENLRIFLTFVEGVERNLGDLRQEIPGNEGMRWLGRARAD